jgi:hypothetical protein
MFPPNLRNAVDGLPFGVQLAIYGAVFVFTIAVLGASVAWSRRREKGIDQNNVLLPSVASIADMRPVREGVEIGHKILDLQERIVDRLEEIERRLTEIKTELIVASRLQDRQDRRR